MKAFFMRTENYYVKNVYHKLMSSVKVTKVPNT